MTFSRIATLFLLIFFAAATCRTESNHREFSIEAVGIAPWPETKRLAQALEFVYELNPFQVVDVLKFIVAEFLDDDLTGEERLDVREKEDDILKKINSTFFQSPFTGPLMALTVDNKYYSARIEAMRSQERFLSSFVTEKASGCTSQWNSSSHLFSVRTYVCVPQCHPVHEGYQLYQLCTSHDLESFLQRQSLFSHASSCRVSSKRYQEKGFFTHPCSSTLLYRPLTLPHGSFKGTHEKERSFMSYPFFLFFSSLDLFPKEYRVGYKEFYQMLEILQNKKLNIFSYFSHGHSPEQSSYGKTSIMSNVSECLSGYSLSLSLRNTEYSMLDVLEANTGEKDNKASENRSDFEGQEGNKNLDERNEFQTSRTHPVHDIVNQQDMMDMTKGVVSKAQIEQLGIKAATFLDTFCTSNGSESTSAKKLSCLVNISSNFPQEVWKLLKIPTSDKLVSALMDLHETFKPKAFSIMMNGRFLSPSFPGILHILKDIGPLIFSVEALVRAKMTLADALQWIDRRQSSAEPQSVKKKQYFILPHEGWTSFPARLDWRWTISHQFATAMLPFPSVFHVESHPKAASWETLPEYFSFLSSSKRLLKFKATLHYIIIVFNPLVPQQVSSVTSFLGLEIPMVLYFLPRASTCYHSDLSQRKSVCSRDFSVEENSSSSSDALVSPVLRKCLVEKIVASMFLHLLPFHKEGMNGPKSLKDKLMSRQKVMVAMKFLRTLQTKNTALTYELLKRKFIHSGGSQSQANRILETFLGNSTQWRDTDWYTKVSCYLDQKGLVSNLVLVNGKVFPLKSIKKVSVIHDEPTVLSPNNQELTFTQAFIKSLVEDQRYLMSSMKENADSVAEKKNELGYIYLHQSVPTCAFLGQEYSESFHVSRFCFVHKQAQQEDINMDTRFDPWSSHHGIPFDALAYTSSFVPTFDSRSFDSFPSVWSTLVSLSKPTRDLTRTPQLVWPLDVTLITDFHTPHGIEMFFGALEHFRLTLDKKTPVTQRVGESLELHVKFQWIFLDVDNDIQPVQPHHHDHVAESLECIMKCIFSQEDKKKNQLSLVTLRQRFILVQFLFQAFQEKRKNGTQEVNTFQQLKDILSHIFPAWLAHVKKFLSTSQGQSIIPPQDIQAFHDRLMQCPYTPRRMAQVEALNRYYDRFDTLTSRVRPGGIRMSSTSPSLIVNHRIIPLEKSFFSTTHTPLVFGFIELLCLDYELFNLMASEPPRWLKDRVEKQHQHSIVEKTIEDSYALDTVDFYTCIVAGITSQQLKIPLQDEHELEKKFFNVDSSLFIHLPGPLKDLPSPLRLLVLLDPLSSHAQEWIPLLQVLNHGLNIEVSILLNPAQHLSSYPLNRWFRQVVRFPSVLSLTPQDPGQIPLRDETRDKFCLGTLFKSLKTNETLLLEVNTPQTWLMRVESDSGVDLDNIRPDLLSTVTQPLQVTFLLKSLVIEGLVAPFCMTSKRKILQMQPHHERKNHGKSAMTCLSLSQLMQQNVIQKPCVSLPKKKDSRDLFYPNETITSFLALDEFGYFQLRSSPGCYTVQLSNKFSKENVEIQFSKQQEEFSLFPVETSPSLCFLMMNALVQRHPLYFVASKKKTSPSILPSSWMSRSSLLIWPIHLPRLKHFFPILFPWNPFSSLKTQNQCTERIHIFALVSGFLYERLLHMMMLSVRTHTTCPLSFWLLDNFLSPQFRLFLPSFAQRYDIDYHYVSYKYPFIFKKEKEKQRTVWIYKVLFLDVLFPPHVKRIIYLDADQIIRGDLLDLWRFNLNNRVYGLVKFCNSNEETKEFRFWEHGYWKEYLQGKPYFNSAIFIVDLVKFKKEKTGDFLRSSYVTLSQDVESLANLDQDLINFLQHKFPIFPLPSTWLWCATWCSKDSLANAKVIDFCNNPLTKEPKLAQAFRLLPEYSYYDQTIRSLQQSAFGRFSTKQINSVVPETKELNSTLMTHSPLDKDEL